MPSRIQCRRGLPEYAVLWHAQRMFLHHPFGNSSGHAVEFSCGETPTHCLKCLVDAESLYNCISAPPVLSRVVRRPLELLFFVTIHV